MNTPYIAPSTDLTRHVLQSLEDVKEQGSGWTAKCPGHADKHSSLSIDTGDDGRVLLCCHAGCHIEHIIGPLNLTIQDLFPPKEGQKRERNPLDGFAAIYDYTDENGELLFQVCRKESTDEQGERKKDFLQRRPDRERPGAWIYKRAGIEPVLYQLPAIAKEISEGERHIFLVEGEKDADRLRGGALCATTAAGGAGKKWLPSYSQSLQGAHVALLGDNDEPGRKYMAMVAAALYPQAASVKIIDLALETEKGDVSDWLDLGHTLKELVELREQTPVWQPSWSRGLVVEVELGNDNKYTFGRRCFHSTIKKVHGEETPVDIPFAAEVWPRQRYRALESGEYGYRLVYLDPMGKPRHATIPAGAATDRNTATRVCKELASEGVGITPDSRGQLAIALGHWSQKTSPPLVSLVATSGWHEDRVYVNGDKIFGAPGWHVDEASPAILNRTGRGGTLEGWCEGVCKYVTTRGLKIALAQSLTGALIAPLHLHPFALHLCVDSTRGKSTAALLAAALWGHPDQTFKTWNTTAKSPEALAEQMNGACLILDEIAQFEGDARALGHTIHALCSPVGRSALDKNRDLSEQRRWRCSVLSTGEVSAKQRLGEFYQGGHRVRFLDVQCNPGDENAVGDLATSKHHAEQLGAFCHEHYGHASDTWIAYLTQPGVMAQLRSDYESWRARAEEFTGDNPEDGRIGAQLAILATALSHSRVAGLTPWTGGEINQLLQWVISAVLHADDDDNEDDEQRFKGNTPNERAYGLFLEEYFAQPKRFPNADTVRAEMAQDVIAYKQTTPGNQETKLYTTEGMLAKSGIPERAGVSIRRWVKWCIKMGVATRDADRARLANGLRSRWIVFEPRI